MFKLSFKTGSDWRGAVENQNIDASGDTIRLMDGVIPLEVVDDFNDGVLGPLWATSTEIGEYGSAPVESDGFLQFDYPSPSGQKKMEVALNSPRGGIECETRFIWESLGAGNGSVHANEWGFALLKGTFIDPPMTTADFNDRLLWELTFGLNPSNGIGHILPVACDSTGQKKAFDGTNWVNFPGLGLYGFSIGPVPSTNIPVTMSVTKGTAGGVIIKAWRNDDPSQVIFQTTESPALRNLTGDTYLDIARSIWMNSARIKFDYFKLSGQPMVPPSGFLRLRKTFDQMIKAVQFDISRDLSQGSRVDLQFRAGDTVADVESKSFSSPVSDPSGVIDVGSGKVLETKVSLIRASPSPIVSQLNIGFSYDFIEDDRPVILSLNEVGRRSNILAFINPSLAPLVCDKDPNTQWQSVNNTDGFFEGLAVQFLDEDGWLEERMVDTLILLNTNFRNTLIRLLDIGQQLRKEINLELYGPNVLITFDPISTAMISFAANTTNPADQVKKLGEIYAGRLLSVLPNFDRYEPRRELLESGNLRTLGGKLVAYRGADKYACRWGISLVDKDKKDTLEKVFRENTLVTFYPEPKYRPHDLFDVSWNAREIAFPYSESVKTVGYKMEASMEEV